VLFGGVGASQMGNSSPMGFVRVDSQFSLSN